ncbi:hypothetical protein ABZ468_08075 [Streptomyces sp. NPDC005708]|uniref:hypothetical protein n=1 Tax=Streptomyces sp. NPDC005708 TaxID=3154564 RepID=UPI0033CEE156
MSTKPVPLPAAEPADTAALVDKVAAVYARGGEILDRYVVDIHLAEVADKAACSLLRDRWEDSFPIAAYTELLCAVAALREVLGFDPSPTGVEVFDWARQIKRKSEEAIDGPSGTFVVQFVGGPYSGVVMGLAGSTSGPRLGPADVISLPIAWGDSTEPGHGEAHYRRSDTPSTDGLWQYRLRAGFPAPPDGARPHITAPAAAEGAA